MWKIVCVNKAEWIVVFGFSFNIITARKDGTIKSV